MQLESGFELHTHTNKHTHSEKHEHNGFYGNLQTKVLFAVKFHMTLSMGPRLKVCSHVSSTWFKMIARTENK